MGALHNMRARATSSPTRLWCFRSAMPKPRQMSGVNSVVTCSRWSARAGMAAVRGAWGGSPTVGRWG
eukprot:4309019-Prymnesium_polylepis.1